MPEGGFLLLEGKIAVFTLVGTLPGTAGELCGWSPEGILLLVVGTSALPREPDLEPAGTACVMN